jgi:hypothetical protein
MGEKAASPAKLKSTASHSGDSRVVSARRNQQGAQGGQRIGKRSSVLGDIKKPSHFSPRDELDVVFPEQPPKLMLVTNSKSRCRQTAPHSGCATAVAFISSSS